MQMSRRTLLGVVILSIIMLCGAINIVTETANAATATTKLTVSVKHPKLDTIKLKWNKVTGAAGYNVYVSLDDGKNYQLAAAVNNTSMVFDDLTRDKVYRFKVIAYKMSGGIRTEFLSSSQVISNSNKIGIDVSRWQYDIDWAKVKAADIQFAIIRSSGSSTEGDTFSQYTDPYFTQNITNAIKNKIPVGVYHYSKATTVAQAKKEAKYVLSLIKGYKITYPVVIDMEDSVQDALSKSTNTKIANAFCQVVKDAGYTPMLYSGCNFSKNNFNLDEIPYDMWIAHYSKDGSVVNNHYHFNSDEDHYPYTRMWQYSSSIKLDGIPKNTVDHNYEFDIKESVFGNTHFNMKTGVISYQASSSDTIQTVATKNAVTEATVLAMNPSISTSTKLSGKTLKISSVTLGKPVLKITTYQFKTPRLAWDAVIGASQYIIQRSDSINGTYKTLATVDAMRKYYGDTSAVFGKTYYYRVVAIGQDNTNSEKVYSSKVAFRLEVPKVSNLKAVSQNYNTIKLNWSKVTGAENYIVQYATSKNGSYKTLATVTTNSFTKSGLTVGRIYYFKVLATYTDKNGKHISTASMTSAKPAVNKVKSLKVSSSTYKSVSLSFKKASDAQFYYIYRSVKSGSGYKKIGKTTSGSYKDTNVKTGTTYYYKVVSYRKVSGKNHKSAMTSYVKVKPSLKKAVVSKITAGSGKLTLTYKKVSGASGYQIYRATSKNGTYKRVATTSKTTYSNTKLSRKKTYYYKVRAYRTVSGKKVYGSFSSIVSKKTK